MLGSLISPKIGLGLIKHEIQKQTGLKVKDFSIFYVKKYSNLKFKITDENNKVHEFPFIDEGNKLASIITHSIKGQLNTKLDIDAFVLSYIDKKIVSEIYYKDEKGEKTVSHLKL